MREYEVPNEIEHELRRLQGSVRTLGAQVEARDRKIDELSRELEEAKALASERGAA